MYGELINFWRKIADQSRVINSFLHGDDSYLKKKTSDAQQSKLVYPYLALDVYEVDYTNIKISKITFNFDVILARNIAADDFQQIDDSQNELHIHLTNIIAAITRNYWAHEGTFSFSPAEQIIKEGRDPFYGWLISGTYTASIDCSDLASEFNNIELFMQAQFTWSSDGSTITFTDTSVENNAIENAWTSKIEGINESEIEYTGEVITIPVPSKSMWVKLQTTDISGQYTQTARAFIYPNEARLSGASVLIESTKELNPDG